MSAASAPPPPPPPGGNDPRKNFPGHNSAGSKDGGDGRSMATAIWTTGARNKNSRHFIVNRQLEPVHKWVRCHLGDAVMESETGFDVYDSMTGRRVHFNYVGVPQNRYAAFYAQDWEITQEEQARVARHESVGGEDLMEGKWSSLLQSGISATDTDQAQVSKTTSSTPTSPQPRRLLPGVSSIYLPSTPDFN
jgi:hypothetical protein